MSDNHDILLCDIGGTHARFARFVKPGEYADFCKYRLDAYDAFENIVSHYLDETGADCHTARFSVARTPVDGVVAYKRFAGDPDYRIDFPALKKTYRWRDMRYMNDLAAAAHGVAAIEKRRLKTVLSPACPPRNNDKIIVSVGTGVGHAAMAGGRVLQTHGGHMLPVTVTAQQRDIEQFIRKKKEETLALIMEDFVSARGLRMITESVSGQDNLALSHEEFMTHLKNHPDAVRLFFEFLGLHVHMLVSVTGFYGGVYLTGGVIDHLVKNRLTNWGAFDEYFRPVMVSVVNESLGGVAVDYVTDRELPLLGLTVADHD